MEEKNDVMNMAEEKTFKKGMEERIDSEKAETQRRWRNVYKVRLMLTVGKTSIVSQRCISGNML